MFRDISSYFLDKITVRIEEGNTAIDISGTADACSRLSHKN